MLKGEENGNSHEEAKHEQKIALELSNLSKLASLVCELDF
jgi:hypothetical protein